MKPDVSDALNERKTEVDEVMASFDSSKATGFIYWCGYYDAFNNMVSAAVADGLGDLEILSNRTPN